MRIQTRWDRQSLFGAFVLFIIFVPPIVIAALMIIDGGP